MFAVKLSSNQARVRALRIEARKLYNTCKFEQFKLSNCFTNTLEHEYKMLTQSEVGKG